MIRTEVYKFSKTIKEKQFYKYRILGEQYSENFYSDCAKLAHKFSVINKFKPVLNKNKQEIYTLEKFEVFPEDSKLIIQYIGEEVLDLATYGHIYEEWFGYLISNKLKIKKLDKSRKYEIKNNSVAHCESLFLRDGVSRQVSSNGITVYRTFEFQPRLIENEMFVYISVRNMFKSNESIANYINQNKNIIGLKVKYDWINIQSTGEVIELLDKTVSEPLEELGGKSTIDYLKESGREYFIKNLKEEDFSMNVVRVKFGKSAYCYMPQGLFPVVTREYISLVNPKFSKQLDNIIKMDMDYRFRVIEQFIMDIGYIAELESGYISSKHNDVTLTEYTYKQLSKPQIFSKSHKINKYHDIFKYGYHKTPDKISVGILYPEKYKTESLEALRKIYSFNNLGYVLNDKKEKINYAKEKLIPFEFNSEFNIAYDLGDITEYKRIIMERCTIEKVDLVLCVIPTEEDEDNPYLPFKTELAKYQVPSQMITLDAAGVINNCSVGEQNKMTYKGLYYLHNIALGIVAKTGGVPWILKEDFSGVDCFIGIDVANPSKGIRIPTSAVVFDKHGQLISYYKPSVAQRGEKIDNEVLQGMFDNIMLGYFQQYREYPKHVVIHRDGFAREEVEWYVKYFDKRGTKFDIVEVKKSNGIRFGIDKGNNIENPESGTMILNKNEAHLVTTDIKPSLGAPRPLKIQVKHGDLDIEEAAKQIYYLSEMHVGAIRSTRLPITTEYADRIAKHLYSVPSDRVEARLFFL